MANKIITFGDSSKNYLNTNISSVQDVDSSLEVYTDIDMVAGATNNTHDIYEISATVPIQLSNWKLNKDVNVKAVFNSLRNIFSWLPGERILLPEFGSRLRTLLYEGITPETEEQIVAEIRGSVSEWEPRVSILDVRDISTIDDTEDNTIHLEVIFSIPSISEKQYAYSFSFNRNT